MMKSSSRQLSHRSDHRCRFISLRRRNIVGFLLGALDGSVKDTGVHQRVVDDIAAVNEFLLLPSNPGRGCNTQREPIAPQTSPRPGFYLATVAAELSKPVAEGAKTVAALAGAGFAGGSGNRIGHPERD